MINKLNFVTILLILNSFTNFAQNSFEIAFPNLTFTSALDMQNAGDGSNRLFVVERAGRIKVFQNESSINLTKIFLDITDRVTAGGETGLLGLAFHPDYESNGYFYVNYTAPSPLRTVISRFSVSFTNPDSANKNSELILLEYNQPYSNHNGGCIAFGPDGYLYIAAGDGGSGGDPQNNAQNITNLLGKIIRLDVDNPQPPLNYGIPSDNPFIDSTNVNVIKEIYAWGLRNTWRFSFDPVTGWLWAGDVGQGDWEEVDIIQNGKNYGWRCYEGNHPYNLSGCNGTYENPIWEYSHSLGFSITGGYVYRGQNVPELNGKYICGDYVSTRVWAIDYDGINPATSVQITTAPGSITSFGVDENDELYLVSFNGKIYRFTPTIQIQAPTELVGQASMTLGIPPHTLLNELTWIDNSNNEDGFTIERKNGNQAFIVIDSVDSNSTFYMDNDIIDSTLYTYKVRAFKDGIFSGYSNEIDVLSLLRPIDGPMGVNASPLDSARIQINWLNPSNSYGTIVIERKDLINGTFFSVDSVSQGTDNFVDNNLLPSTTYYYRLYSFYQNLVSDYSNVDSAKTSPLVDVASEYTLSEYKLYQNFPNPFNPTTIISYQIPQQGFVTLKIFDVLGNVIKTLVNEEKQPGVYQIEFDATKFASGIYVYKLNSGNYNDAKKMTIIK